MLGWFVRRTTVIIRLDRVIQQELVIPDRIRLVRLVLWRGSTLFNMWAASCRELCSFSLALKKMEPKEITHTTGIFCASCQRIAGRRLSAPVVFVWDLMLKVWNFSAFAAMGPKSRHFRSLSGMTDKQNWCLRFGVCLIFACLPSVWRSACNLCFNNFLSVCVCG